MNRVSPIFIALACGMAGAWFFSGSGSEPTPSRAERSLDVPAEALKTLERTTAARRPPTPTLPPADPTRIRAACPLPTPVDAIEVAVAIGAGDLEQATATVIGEHLHLDLPASALSGTLQLPGFAPAAVGVVRTPSGSVECTPIQLVPEAPPSP